MVGQAPPQQEQQGPQKMLSGCVARHGERHAAPALVGGGEGGPPTAGAIPSAQSAAIRTSAAATAFDPVGRTTAAAQGCGAVRWVVALEGGGGKWWGWAPPRPTRFDVPAPARGPEAFTGRDRPAHPSVPFPFLPGPLMLAPPPSVAATEIRAGQARERASEMPPEDAIVRMSCGAGDDGRGGRPPPRQPPRRRPTLTTAAALRTMLAAVGALLLVLVLLDGSADPQRQRTTTLNRRSDRLSSAAPRRYLRGPSSRAGAGNSPGTANASSAGRRNGTAAATAAGPDRTPGSSSATSEASAPIPPTPPPVASETEAPDVEAQDAEIKQDLQHQQQQQQEEEEEEEEAAEEAMSLPSSSSSEVRVEHSEDEDDGNGGDHDEAHDPAPGTNSSTPAPSSHSGGKEANAPSKTATEHPEVVPANAAASGSETSEEELLAKEEAKVRRVSGFGAAAGVFAMIFTAWQMSENPDGIYAATCRLVLTVCNLVVRLAMAPCHKCCPGLCSWCLPSSSSMGVSGAHYRHTYGHVPAALDYGYRDPSLELS